MKAGSPSLQPTSLFTNACKRSLLATCSAIALGLGIAACEQQDQQEAGVVEQGMEKAKQAGKEVKPKAEKASKKAVQGAKKAVEPGMKDTRGKSKGAQGAKPSTGSAPAPTTGSIPAKAPSPKFLSLDINGDGQLSAGELRGNPMLKKNINKLDANGDGQLSPPEFAAASEMNEDKKTGGATGGGGAGPSGHSTENTNAPAG